MSVNIVDRTDNQYDYSNIPRCLQNELEFVIDDFKQKIMDLMNNNDCGVKNRLYSRMHTYKNFNFRLMVLPRARLTSSGSIEGNISAYLEAVPSPNWPSSWIWINTKYTVTLVNQKDYRKSYFMSDIFNFKGENNMDDGRFRLMSEPSNIMQENNMDYYSSAGPEADRGWSDFFNIKTILDARSGFMDSNNDRVVFRAGVFPMSCEPNSMGKGNVEMFSTERSCTGHVGLRNLGATCYMNSLLQSLYHIGRFRKAVYSIPLSNNCSSIPSNPCNSSQNHGSVRLKDDSCIEQDSSFNKGHSTTDPKDAGRSPMILLGDSTEDPVDWSSSLARSLFESENDGIASLESIMSSSNISSHELSNSNGLNNRNSSYGNGDGSRGSSGGRNGAGGNTDGPGGANDQIKISSALQTLFYELQTSNDAANCRELMRSFGWDASDAFTQHDAQELNRLLCDRLEEEMKNTTVDGSIKDLFEGEYENFIDCLDVDCTSRRRENFYDIQIDVEGVGSLEEGLEKFVEEEILEGDNMYEAEGYGKQRARKGVRFQRFPPVVQFHLKRFQFNIQSMDMIKLNDYFSFPERLDLTNYTSDSGKERNASKNSQVYILHTVVIHQGDVHSGHYYAYIRPNPDSNWYRFDDEKVTLVSSASAIEDNFGGFEYDVWDYLGNPEREVPKRLKTHSAYILVYIKENQAKELLDEPVPHEVNPDLVVKYQREQEIVNLRRRLRNDINEHVRVRLLLSTDYNRSGSSRAEIQSVHTSTNTFPWSCVLKCPREYPISKFHRDIEERFVGVNGRHRSSGLVSHLFLLVSSDYGPNNAGTGGNQGAGRVPAIFGGHNMHLNGSDGSVSNGLSFGLCISSQELPIQFGSSSRARGGAGRQQYGGSAPVASANEEIYMSDICRRYHREGLWDSSCPTLCMCLYLESFSGMTDRITPSLPSLSRSYLEKRQRIENSLRRTNGGSQVLLLLRYFDIFDPNVNEYSRNFFNSNEIPNLYNLGVVMVSSATVLKDLNDYVLMEIEKEMPDIFSNIRSHCISNKLSEFNLRICLETTNGVSPDLRTDGPLSFSKDDERDARNAGRDGALSSGDARETEEGLGVGFSSVSRFYPLLDPRCSIQQLRLAHGSSLIFSFNMDESVIMRKRNELVSALGGNLDVLGIKDWLEEERVRSSATDGLGGKGRSLPKELSEIEYPEFPAIDFCHWFENCQNSASVCIYLWNPLDGEYSYAGGSGFNVTQNPEANRNILVSNGGGQTHKNPSGVVEYMHASGNPIVRSFSKYNIKSVHNLTLDLRWPAIKSWIFISDMLNVDPRCLALARNSLNPYEASLTTLYSLVQAQMRHKSTRSLFKSLCLSGYHGSPGTGNGLRAPSPWLPLPSRFSVMAVELAGRSFCNLSLPNRQLISLSIVDWEDTGGGVKARSLVQVDISKSVDSLIEDICSGRSVVAYRDFAASRDANGGGIDLNRIFASRNGDSALPRLRILEFSNGNTVGLYKGNEKLSNILNIEDGSKGEGVLSVGYISEGLRLERDFTYEELRGLENGDLNSVLVIQDYRDLEHSVGNAFVVTLRPESRLADLKNVIQNSFKLQDKDISKWKFYRFEFKNLQLIRDNDVLLPSFNKNLDINVYGFSPNITILAQLQQTSQNSHKNNSSRPLRI